MIYKLLEMETRSAGSMKNKKRNIEEISIGDIKDSLSLKNVIALCEFYSKHKKIEPNIYRKIGINKTTIKRLTGIIKELRDLDKIIGIEDAKQTSLEHVVYLAQNLSSDEDMNHIQIVGEPGVGKTTLAHVLGHIYAGLGFLENGEVISVTRADLIGEHLGSTCIKTEDMLNMCRGNVMFIDEVYSFGCNDRRDSFSKECLDCINQFLSTNRKDLLCIIAGYEQDIQDCVFSINKGLERRFPFKYVLTKYDNVQLKSIFIHQVKSNDWNIDENEPVLNEIFNESNMHYFNSSGGDTEILFMRCKMAHSSRIFLEHKRSLKKKTLNNIDIKRGFDMFVNSKRKSKVNENISMMYI